MDLTPGPFMRLFARRLDPDAPGGLYATIGAGLGIGFVALFLAIAEDVMESARLAFDTDVHVWLAASASPALARVMWLATLLGDTRVVVVEVTAAMAVLLAWGHVRRAIVLPVLVLAAAALADVLKVYYARPRPSAPLALIASPGSASFPSGHAIATIAFFGALAVMLLASRSPRWARIAGTVAASCAALAVGVSRVYLGVHFASDVVASWALGGALLSSGMAALLSWERLVPPSRPRWRPGAASVLRWVMPAASLVAVIAVMVFEAAANPLL
jgi:membrane-associated phospholipid phosphatase